ncbi:NAD(P)-binding domain-containing protein [Streptomyces sp. SJL17-1]|uniref:NAD(P)-binding domain-containing protein n=1 Tax=Streptomyces sp. SJL17-1 TaxID=2967223 RepID=UPI00398FAB70
MKIAVLGTGEVGRRLATKLVSLGHEVAMGSRTPTTPSSSSAPSRRPAWSSRSTP